MWINEQNPTRFHPVHVVRNSGCLEEGNGNSWGERADGTSFAIGAVVFGLTGFCQSGANPRTGISLP